MSYHAKTGTLRVWVNGDKVACGVEESFGAINFKKHTIHLKNQLTLYYQNTPGIFDNFRASQESGAE